MATTRFTECARAYVEKTLPHARAYEKEKLLQDWLTKETIAPGILSDFKKRVGTVSGKRVLDVGFGNGITLAAFAKDGAQMKGLEVSSDLHVIATAYLAEAGITATLEQYDGVTFPFADASFDYVYSVSVLEHVSHPGTVLQEIYRVLSPGGKLYLAFPNRITLKETHTGLYFISYLPRSIARGLLLLLGYQSLDDWNLHFLDYFWLRRLLAKYHIPFQVVFETDSPSWGKRLFKKTLGFFGIHHSALLPHVMVILRKE